MSFERPAAQAASHNAGRNQTVLAQIDDVWSRLALARSQAQVACTEVRLRHELSELNRYQKLRGRDAITDSELEAKRVVVLELQANLAEAKASVEEEQERKERSKIRALFDGVVVAKHAELGGHVSPGTPIVDIVSRGHVDARLMVPESVINRIQVGGRLPVRIDPLGEEVPGTVVSVTPYGPWASRTSPVRIRVDDQGRRLKAGMSVTAVISTGPEREALVVPKDGVLVRPDGSTLWVAVRDENRGSDVAFYRADGTFIGEDKLLQEGQSARVMVSDLAPGETYKWYAIARGATLEYYGGEPDTTRDEKRTKAFSFTVKK